jgi:biopolymer transport protein ExbD
MRFARPHRNDHMRAVEITPLIDVVFLLIIFFMTTARFAQITRAELDLPKERGEQREKSEEAGIIINIDAQGRILVGREEVSIDDLESIVAEEATRARGRDPTRLRLMIRADRECDTARLNDVLTRLQRLGVAGVRIATEVPQ